MIWVARDEPNYHKPSPYEDGPGHEPVRMIRAYRDMEHIESEGLPPGDHVFYEEGKTLDDDGWPTTLRLIRKHRQPTPHPDTGAMRKGGAVKTFKNG